MVADRKLMKKDIVFYKYKKIYNLKKIKFKIYLIN